MNKEEMKSHFSMWCMIASPLMIGNDLRSIAKETLEILSNKEAIAINQDSLGIQGKLVEEQSQGLQVWLKELHPEHHKKRYAIALFNRTAVPVAIPLNLNKLGLTDKYKMRDIWLHKDLGKTTKVYQSLIPAHGIKMILLE